MAKAGFNAGEFASGVFQRRDPVKGDTKTFVRYPHARQSAPRLKWHQACVRQGMANWHPEGANARERSQNLRTKLAQVSQQCEAQNPHPRRETGRAAPSRLVIARA